MTQKELLYVEDAVMHEKSIIKLCNDFLSKLTDDDLIMFINNQIESHQRMENRLINLLKEQANG